MIEQRVGKLEQDVARVLVILKRLEPAIREMITDNRQMRKDVSDLTVKLAGLEAQVRALPNFLQLMVTLITTWSAGAAIVFTIVKFGAR